MEKKDNGSTAKKVFNLAKPVIENLGFVIWDVEFKKEGASWFLRIFIDKEGGIFIEDCEKVSRAMDKILDEKDFIEQNYFLEISSPGIERELKIPEHFKQFEGSMISVSLYKPIDGKKDYKGMLVEQKEGNIYIKINGDTLRFEKNNVAKVKLSVEF